MGPLWESFQRILPEMNGVLLSVLRALNMTLKEIIMGKVRGVVELKMMSSPLAFSCMTSMDLPILGKFS